MHTRALSLFLSHTHTLEVCYFDCFCVVSCGYLFLSLGLSLWFFFYVLTQFNIHIQETPLPFGFKSPKNGFSVTRWTILMWENSFFYHFKTSLAFFLTLSFSSALNFLPILSPVLSLFWPSHLFPSRDANRKRQAKGIPCLEPKQTCNRYLSGNGKGTLVLVFRKIWSVVIIFSAFLMNLLCTCGAFCHISVNELSDGQSIKEYSRDNVDISNHAQLFYCFFSPYVYKICSHFLLVCLIEEKIYQKCCIFCHLNIFENCVKSEKGRC